METFSIKGQTINIDLNHFANKEYTCLVVHGEKHDTVAHAKLDKAGRTTLVFKEKFKNYKGMARFILEDGNGLEFVVNNENFNVLCTAEILNPDTVKFIKSPENEYFVTQSITKQKLLQKAQLSAAVLTLYNENDDVYAPFKKEQQKLNEKYKAQKSTNEKSSLYAARMMEIFDFLMGNSDDLNDDDGKKIVQANSFVLSKLNIDDLYTSNYWNDVLNTWLLLQLQQTKDDAQLLETLEQVGSRINGKTQFTSFAELAVRQMAKIGRDNALSSFGSYLGKSDKIENPGHNLLAAMGGPQTGMKAPELVWKEGNYVFDKKQKTLLVFYETGCNNCDNEINLLIGNYQELQKKGYEVVTAASDVDPAEYQKNAARFPWKNKFSDFRGQAGYNFITFGVIGTPTIFVIDENGTITGRYARLADAHILN